MEDKQARQTEKINCWEVFECGKKDCPAYESGNKKCWLLSGTHCRDEVQGKFLEKMEICINCDIFKKNIDAFSIQETMQLINRQLKEFRQIVEERDSELRRLATTDRLTGVYNRTKFDEIIGREKERFERYGTPLCMLMLDIDHFKNINDMHGHSAGDYVLKTVAGIIGKTIRKIDYLLRWGGEEFIIISPETKLGEAHALAERVRKIIESYRFDKVGEVTVSLGVTEIKEGDTIDRFVKRADEIMYEAKIKGRNRVEVGM